MDALHSLPAPPDLQGRLRSLSTDIQRARVNLATGKLKVEQYEALAGLLDKRLRELEAEVHARILQQARACRTAAWQPKGPSGS